MVTFLEQTSLGAFFLLFVLVIILYLILGVIRGNSSVLSLFLKMGFLIYSGKPKRDYAFIKKKNEDVKGFLSIPNTVYAPVFPYSNGKYRYHDFMGRKNTLGELIIDESDLSQSLKPLSLTPSGVFGDLTIIKGSMSNRASSIANSKFSSLIRYVNTDLKKQHPIISLRNDNKVINYKLVFALEMSLENKKPLDFSTRDKFLASLRKIAFYDTREPIHTNVLILNGSTGIDSVLLILKEVEVK